MFWFIAASLLLACDVPPRSKGKVSLPVASSVPLSGRDGGQLVRVSLPAIVPAAVTGRTARPPRIPTNPRQ